MANGKTIGAILSPDIAYLNFDIQKWIKKGYSDNFGEYEYEYERAERVRFYLSDNKMKIIDNASKVYGTDILGLSKMVTRIQYEDQLREYDVV